MVYVTKSNFLRPGLTDFTRSSKGDLTGGSLRTNDREEMGLDLKSSYSINLFTHSEQRKTLAGLTRLSVPFMNDVTNICSLSTALLFVSQSY